LSPVRNDHHEHQELDIEEDEIEGDESVAYLHHHYVGDVEVNCMEEDMDHKIPYMRAYTCDSKDDDPDKEINEDRLTAKEVKAFKKVIGRDH
jgi:hypothetical protein